MLKVLELFAGIGACSKALENLGIEHEIVDAVEIDKYAIKSFNAVHGANFEPQDIKEWDKDIKVDLIMHGSPCQDFSLAGKQLGGDKDSGTRSSLMYETIRIVEKLKPKYIIWENVKNLLSKKHKHNFDNYIKKMENLGYTSYYQVLNAKDYGIPQNRERVFTISILNGTNYKFPQKQELKIRLKDMLEDEVDEKYYLSAKQINNIIFSKFTQKQKIIQQKDYCDTLCARDWEDPKCVQVGQRIRKLMPKEYWRLMGFDDESFKRAEKVNSNTQLYKNDFDLSSLKIKNATKKGYDEAIIGDSVNLQQPNSTTRRGRVGHQVSQTLDTSCNQGVVINERITNKEIDT